MKIYQVKDKFFVSYELALEYLHRACKRGVIIRTREVEETPLPRKIPVRLNYRYVPKDDRIYFLRSVNLLEHGTYYNGFPFIPNQMFLEYHSIGPSDKIAKIWIDLEFNSIREINWRYTSSENLNPTIERAIRENSQTLFESGDSVILLKL